MQRIFAPRWMLAIALAIFVTTLAANATAAKRKESETKGPTVAAAATDLPKDAAFADYRGWKAVYAEPVAVPAKQLTLCDRPPRDDNPHEDGFINVYVNAAGRDAYLGLDRPNFEPGTIIVKEKLAGKEDADPYALGVMIKRDAGFAPKSGDWQFLFVDAEGKLSDDQTELESCTRCHRMKAQDDFVFRKPAAK